MSVTLKRSGMGVNVLIDRLKAMDDKKLDAGWFESAKYADTGAPVAGIMAQNEFGNPGRSIPARPFMRPAAEDNSKKWAKIAKDGFKAALVNGSISPRQVLGVLGNMVVADIKGAIVSGNLAPLSPVTIALRKHRDEGQKIGGAFVGAVAAAIAEGKTGSGQLGDQSYSNTDPLRDTGYAISTLTSEVS